MSEAHIRIESDGTTGGTRVYAVNADGKRELLPARTIIWEMDAETGECMASVTFTDVELSAIAREVLVRE